jgi:N-acetylglutamate synthase-like GNAT family acetyltransferase
MKTRAAKKNDLELILRFCRELSPNFDDEILRKSFPTIVDDKNAVIFIAETEENAAGFIEAHVQWSLQSGLHAIIRALYISEKYRRYGYAKTLVEHVQKWAESMSAGKIVVQSKIERDAADQFYKKMGYSKFKIQNVYQRSLIR